MAGSGSTEISSQLAGLSPVLHVQGRTLTYLWIPLGKLCVHKPGNLWSNWEPVWLTGDKTCGVQWFLGHKKESSNVKEVLMLTRISEMEDDMKKLLHSDKNKD